MAMQHMAEKKETVDGGMRNGVAYVCGKELKRVINDKLLKENKATDESGMIAESNLV